eukprot:PhM_4_TR7822/c0_g1_i1/m.105631
MSKACHIIDGDGKFATPANFQTSLDTIEHKADKYWVVGIFGGQSTGKSTLLNGVFGTRFDVMNVEGERSQTTRGIWLAPSSQCPTLFAMDVEGTDGQERFDNQTFERRTSLFALAACDVLLINMWTAEVGRFNAANLSLLRTIFELRLQLFPRGAEKTKLLFVLRDHVSGTLEKHSEVIRKSLTKVWEGVYRAEADHSVDTVEDVFDVRFFSLPHYELQREDFEAKMAELRDWFTPGKEQCIVSHEGEGTRDGVPLDGLHSYMDSVWATVVANKDLDIPSQKELLAKHRCAEIGDEIIEKAKKQISEWTEYIRREKQPVKGLGDAVTQMAFRASEQMEDEAKLYSGRTVSAQSSQLRETILKMCEEVLQQQVELVLSAHEDRFTKEMHSAVDTALAKGQGPAKTWPAIRSSFKENIATVREMLQQRVVDGTLDNRTHDIAEKRLTKTLRTAVQHRLKVIAQDVHKHMHTAFEYALHHNADGSNRFFQSTTLLTTTANTCQGVGLDYLNSVCANRLDDEKADERVKVVKSGSNVTLSNKSADPDSVPIVVDAAACQRAFELYIQQTDFTVQLIQKGIEMGSNRIPWYFWVALLWFARNDAYYVATSPSILIVICLVAYFFFYDMLLSMTKQFLADPPAWFGYVELALEQHLPGVAAHLREKRAAVAGSSAPKKKHIVDKTNTTDNDDDDDQGEEAVKETDVKKKENNKKK